MLVGQPGLGPDSGFQMPGYEEFIGEAQRSRADYNLRLANVMRLYGIGTESEVMSCCINGLHQKLWNERHDTTNIIIQFRRNLVREFINRFEADDRVKESYQCRLQKASAWYWASYVDPLTEKFTLIRNNDVMTIRFLSFPWVVSNYLAEVYSINRDHNCLAEKNVYLSIWDGLINMMQSRKR